MTKIYLNVLIALGILSSTTRAESRDIAFITEFGYLKITGVENSKYQFANGRYLDSYYSPSLLGVLPAAHIYRMVESHCNALNIPIPIIFLNDSMQINASAEGDQFLNLNLGLLRQLSHHELSGIIAHECGHLKCKHAKKIARKIKKYSRISTITTCGAALLGGAFLLCIKDGLNDALDDASPELAQLLVTLTATGFFGTYYIPKTIAYEYYLAYSRQCEHEADLTACHDAKTAQELIDGLTRISQGRAEPEQNKLTTHPPMKDRIKVIRHYLKTILAEPKPIFASI